MCGIHYYGTVKNQGYDVDARSVLETKPDAGPVELEELIRAERIEAQAKVRQLKERRKMRV